MALTAPTVSGYQAFWSLQGDHAAYAMPLSQGRAKDSKHISRVIRGRTAADAVAALAVLIGAAAGPTATATFSSVPVPLGPQQAVPTVTGIGDLGGLRTAVPYTVINRATTAADVTELKKWFTTALLEAGITYPTRLGPGGGGQIKAGMSAFGGFNS